MAEEFRKLSKLASLRCLITETNEKNVNYRGNGICRMRAHRILLYMSFKSSCLELNMNVIRMPL